MTVAYIIDAVRTPRATSKPGKGAYVGMHPQHLAAAVLKALLDRNGFNSADVDDVIWGTSAQMGLQGGDMGRMAALDAGYDVKVSGVTLDRFCGSGLTAVNFAAAQIMSGMEDLVIAGGTEMMSHVQEYGGKVREAGLGVPGTGLGTGNKRLQEKHPQSNQGLAADAIATMEGITREELDAFALESQRRAAVAMENGYYNNSLIPVYDDEGNLKLDHEQYPRPSTTAQDLAELKPSFAKLADMPLDREGTTFRKLINRRYPDVDIQCFHHAGNSSGVVDGAAAILLASEDYVQKHGLKPRARVVAMANIGDDPTLMLNAPVPAAKKVLEKAGLTKDDIDLWEVNEAFAVVVEKFIRDMGIDRDTINVNGGAIALGHPIGATGPIMIGTVLDELERRGLKRGLVTMCAAGGMAPAIIIERV
ncbi:acetyl-CoA C-acetyltransferase [Pseudomaricurvus sp. HS19]|uniref:acetyl-CoA C-acetyltransferase n=1 Tax=Pseudomaricurvus sp. HS19 TaxID=2692626 RepID=UPI00137024F6|nr:acetyl-CoA C-acetyltransferase [Pseudomaricurvus sp. HS19]MYM64047.1 acetyl-CoA C-acyltransferase [Pseudomaricurvus sp. HS19]